MKERYNIVIADILLSILTDEPKELVDASVAELNTRVTELAQANKRYSKLDVTILCALDYLTELKKAETKAAALETQIAELENEAVLLRQQLETCRSAESAKKEHRKEEISGTENTVREQPQQLTLSPEQESTSENPALPGSEKLRRLEDELRRLQEKPEATSSDESATSAPLSRREEQLREIEKLLRGGGKSLREVLHDAAEN